MPPFILAKELKKRYEIHGRYYDLICNGNSTKCRSLLTIHDVVINNGKKLLVVMLNPGSSSPVDKAYTYPKIQVGINMVLAKIPLIRANPDTTQYQIMRVMHKFKFEHADIVNLYDVMEPQSHALFTTIKKGKIIYESSIFSDTRESELKDYLNQDTPVILAWGKGIAEFEIEKRALSKIAFYTNRIFKVNDSKNRIFHASPFNRSDKIRWLNDICQKLQN